MQASFKAGEPTRRLCRGEPHGGAKKAPTKKPHPKAPTVTATKVRKDSRNPVIASHQEGLAGHSLEGRSDAGGENCTGHCAGNSTPGHEHVTAAQVRFTDAVRHEHAGQGAGRAIKAARIVTAWANTTGTFNIERQGRVLTRTKELER